MSHKFSACAKCCVSLQAGLQEERRAWEDDLYDLGTLLRLADTKHGDGDASAGLEHDGAENNATGPAPLADGQPFGSLAAKTLVRQLEPGDTHMVVGFTAKTMTTVLPDCAMSPPLSASCSSVE